MSLRNRSTKPITLANPHSPISEFYRTIRTNVNFASTLNDAKTFLVTSAIAKEGKTVTASNLAIVSAQAGKKVLIMDVNFRTPGLLQTFQIPSEAGLTNLLVREREIDDCMFETDVKNLMVMPVGSLSPNPYQMLSSKSFAKLIENLHGLFDMIILDGPPVLPTADALLLARLADATLIVVDAQKTNRRQAAKTVTALNRVGAQILGVILNRVKELSDKSIFDYDYKLAPDRTLNDTFEIPGGLNEQGVTLAEGGFN